MMCGYEVTILLSESYNEPASTHMYRSKVTMRSTSSGKALLTSKKDVGTLQFIHSSSKDMASYSLLLVVEYYVPELAHIFSLLWG
jgi:hypothetical protein